MRNNTGESPSDGCWADENGDGELLSLALHRRSSPARPAPPTNSNVPGGLVKTVDKDPADAKKLKKIVECLEVMSLVDEIEGNIVAVFPDHPWTWASQVTEGVLDLPGISLQPVAFASCLLLIS